MKLRLICHFLEVFPLCVNFSQFPPVGTYSAKRLNSKQYNLSHNDTGKPSETKLMDGYTPSLPMKIWMMGREWNLPIFGASLFNSGAGNGNPLSFLA